MSNHIQHTIALPKFQENVQFKIRIEYNANYSLVALTTVTTPAVEIT